MKARLSPKTFVFCAAMIAYAAIIVFPLYIIVATSFKPNAEVFRNTFGLPEGLYLGNYSSMMGRSHFGAYLLNSMIVVGISIAVVVSLSSLASFILAKHPFKGSRAVYAFFVAGLIIPIKLGTISILMMTIGLQWNDSLVSVIVVAIATEIPFGVFILTDFIRMIPEELSNAARIDWASEQGIFLRIILPLLSPPVAAVAIVTFIPVWNDFWFPLVLLKSDSVRTVPLATALLFGQFQTNYGFVFAALTMASLPVIAFYLAFSKYFVKGIAVGGLKG